MPSIPALYTWSGVFRNSLKLCQSHGAQCPCVSSLPLPAELSIGIVWCKEGAWDRVWARRPICQCGKKMQPGMVWGSPCCFIMHQGLLTDSEPRSAHPRGQGRKSGLSHWEGTGVGEMGVGEKSQRPTLPGVLPLGSTEKQAGGLAVI